VREFDIIYNAMKFGSGNHIFYEKRFPSAGTFSNQEKNNLV
jgi:hypothetical protein